MNTVFIEAPIDAMINNRTKDLDIVIIPKTNAGIKQAKNLQRKIIPHLKKEKFNNSQDLGASIIIILCIIVIIYLISIIKTK